MSNPHLSKIRFIFRILIKSPLSAARIFLTVLPRCAAEAIKRKEYLKMLTNIRRGDIFYADLSPVVGSEQGGLRPVLIIQNDVGNRYSPTVIAAAITSRMGKTRLPTHIDVHADKMGLAKDSVILLEQIRTLDKRRLKEKMGHLDSAVMTKVNNAIAVSFGLGAGIGGSAIPDEAAADIPHGAVASVADTYEGTEPNNGFLGYRKQGDIFSKVIALFLIFRKFSRISLIYNPFSRKILLFPIDFPEQL